MKMSDWTTRNSCMYYKRYEYQAQSRKPNAIQTTQNGNTFTVTNKKNQRNTSKFIRNCIGMKEKRKHCKSTWNSEQHAGLPIFFIFICIWIKMGHQQRTYHFRWNSVEKMWWKNIYFTEDSSVHESWFKNQIRL